MRVEKFKIVCEKCKRLADLDVVLEGEWEIDSVYVKFFCDCGNEEVVKDES